MISITFHLVVSILIMYPGSLVRFPLDSELVGGVQVQWMIPRFSFVPMCHVYFVLRWPLLCVPILLYMEHQTGMADVHVQVGDLCSFKCFPELAKLVYSKDLSSWRLGLSSCSLQRLICLHYIYILHVYTYNVFYSIHIYLHIYVHMYSISIYILK